MSITHDHLTDEESPVAAFSLDAAAQHLGLAPEELRWRLEGGETLAEIAADEGRTLEELLEHGVPPG